MNGAPTGLVYVVDPVPARGKEVPSFSYVLIHAAFM